MEFKPFNKLPLIKYFQHDLEKINMAVRLSDSIQSDVKNIRAAGDEVELSVKNFFVNKLEPRYHICDGHIVDKNLKVSPQFDIIVCDNQKNPVLFNLSDKSELIYYESVFCFGEVKKSFYKKDLIQTFSMNLKRLKEELFREDIPNNFIECSSSGSGFFVEEPLTQLPKRNPILTFMFFTNTRNNSFSDFRDEINKIENKYMPNFIVLLDTGIILNVNKNVLEKDKIKINLYPEFEKEENVWILLALDEPNNVLTYQYMLLLEHLNNSIVSNPNIRDYTKNLFDISTLNIQKL